MDKISATGLIRETFENPFDKTRYSRFIRELLNSYEEKPFGLQAGNLIKDSFKGSIKSYERIGKYTDTDGNEIDILIIHLCRDTSLAHARTMQRNFIAWYLNGGRGGIQRDGALVAMVSPNEEDWRFSLVRMDYRLETTPTGKVKAKEEFTPARRYSFLVGSNENSHTAQQTLVPLLIKENVPPTLADLEQAFNIEKVTKEFFEKYKNLFIRVKESLDELTERDAKIRTNFEQQGVNTADFAKKLLGQIVFLYFLQKKGWFGLQRDAAWGEGPKDFIRSLFEKPFASYTNFFNDILEPLFYEALAVEREDGFYSRFNCRIPFLNGGLFEPINGYDWIHTDILLPNELFANNNRTPEGDTGDGILDVFDRYNFTVCEDEPLEKEVAVDPEMLGKVFENLLEVIDRKSKGTFYTPREIVHYMCQESLIQHLVTHVTTVSKANIELLIRHGDLVIEHEAIVESKGKETERYSYKLPEPIRTNAAALDRTLASIRVCDPAVGSGAFLVGMMNEIVKARNVLKTYANRRGTTYDLKRHAIHNCLYGVDIDPGAVEIAKLRLWLSLVVDEEDIRQIKPLPNLDYKIMQGNSLLEEYEGIKLFDDSLLANADVSIEVKHNELISRRNGIQQEYFDIKLSDTPDTARLNQLEQELTNIRDSINMLKAKPSNSSQGALWNQANEARQKADELKRLHILFFNESRKLEKDAIRQKIDMLEWDLIEVTLRENNKTASLRDIQRLRNQKVKPFFLWKLHFAEVFEENNGFDIVIANPPYVSYGLRGGQKMTKAEKDSLRELFPQSAEYKISLYALFIDIGIRISRHEGGIQTFITPDSFLLGMYFSKIRDLILRNNRIIELLLLPYGVFRATVGYSVVYQFQRGSTSSLHELNARMALSNDAVASRNFKSYHYPQSFFSKFHLKRFRLFFSEEEKLLVEKVENNSLPLKRFAKVTTGVRSKVGKDAVVSNQKICSSWRKGIISGSQVTQYDVTWNGYWLNIDKDLLFSGGWDKRYVERPKIMIRQTGDTIIAGIDHDGLYHLNNVHTVALISDELDMKYVCAVLNSRLMNKYYHLISLEKDRVMAQTDIETIELLPIKKISLTEQSTIVRVIDSILAVKHQNIDGDTASLEREIDKLVYKLYDLTPEEIALVEQST